MQAWAQVCECSAAWGVCPTFCTTVLAGEGIDPGGDPHFAADAQARLAKTATDMAAAVFPDCTAALDAPLLALEQGTVQARRSQVSFCEGVSTGSFEQAGIQVHWAGGSVLALGSCLQGLRLYWLVLESLVGAEAARLTAGAASTGALLGTPLFHRCLAACSFECVISAYRMVSRAAVGRAEGQTTCSRVGSLSGLPGKAVTY